MKKLLNKQISRVLIAAIAMTGTTMVVIPSSAFAEIEEVIVTARKREESLQEVPVAISVFTGEGLEAAGIQTTRDLFANTPGLNYDTGFDQNAGTPAIRGVVSNEIATYRQKVTTFLDGMPILGQQGSVPFTAIQQVEVLRGPQSAAFGRSTFGGAINYTTVDPGEECAGEINLGIGENGLLNIGAMYGGPMIAGKLGGLIAIESTVRDGEDDWVTVAEGETLGGEDSKNILAKLVWTPTDSMSFEFRYKFLEVDNEQTPRAFLSLTDPNRQLHPDSISPVCGGGIVPPPEPSCAYVGTVNAVDQVYDYNYTDNGIGEPFVRNERDRFEVEANFDLSNESSIQVLAFTSEEYYERATDSNLVNDAFGFERDPTDIEEMYAEVRYTSPGDTRLRYMAGLSYYDYDFLTTVYRSAADFAGGPADGRRISETATNTGLFGNITYDLTDKLTLSLEGRFQNDDVGGTTILDDGSLFELGQVTEAFLPRVSLTYSPSDSTTFYAQASQGNNPAGVNGGAVDPAVVLASQAFPEIFDNTKVAFYEEEEVLSLEIGVKGTVGDRMSYAVNIYKLEWENYTNAFGLDFTPGDFIDLDDDGLGDVGTQYAGMDFGIGRSFLGAGDVDGQGIELEGTFFVTDNLNIGVAASYIDIKYADNACSTSPLDYGVPQNATTSLGLACVSIAGQELGTQPKFAGAVNLQYNRPLNNGMEFFGRFGARFTSKQYVSEMNLAEIDSYVISDLRFGLSKDNWRAELYVDNLFDEDAPQGPQIFFDGRILTPAGTPAPPPFAQNINYTTRRGQNFGARFSYKFGSK